MTNDDSDYDIYDDEYDDEPELDVDEDQLEPVIVGEPTPRPPRRERRDAAKPKRRQRGPRPAPAAAARRAEATADADDILVFTLLDREYRVRRGSALESWDIALGMASENPFQMMLGVLGPSGLRRFAADAKAVGMSPYEASKEFFDVYSAELGISAGNS